MEFLLDDAFLGENAFLTEFVAKVHKPVLGARPIGSGRRWFTNASAIVLAREWQPICAGTSSIACDTPHVVRDLANIRRLIAYLQSFF